MNVFAEVEPNQKERIVLALRKAGNVVGFLGDGINDASALHAADVGISVDEAVDVAKEAADIVLLEKDLEVLLNGVKAGRKTFANTLKYVFMATSANFGNMFSMAGASLFLPFLPMLPKQILLMNLLTDFPEMAIAGDSVDPESVERPHRWDIGFIRRFMVTFGLLSSVFDYLTFGTLLLVLHADAVASADRLVHGVGHLGDPDRAGDSVPPAVLPQRPGRYLVLATLGSVIATLLLPWIPLGRLFGFAPLPPLLRRVSVSDHHALRGRRRVGETHLLSQNRKLTEPPPSCRASEGETYATTGATLDSLHFVLKAVRTEAVWHVKS